MAVSSVLPVDWVCGRSVCSGFELSVGPVAAGAEVDWLEGAVDAEGVAGLDLAEHFGRNE